MSPRPDMLRITYRPLITITTNVIFLNFSAGLTEFQAVTFARNSVVL